MLHGRQSERAAIARLIDEARASRGGAVVLRGLPGVGKSALLAEAVECGEGMRLLHTQGVESESPLPFAALHRLLRPVMRYADQLPDPQARGLRAAFGAAEASGAGDRFLVFLAALSLLAEASEDEPVLAVVDDAQWLDEASAAALLFVARRLHVERVALLFGARAGDVCTFASSDLPSVTLTGIDSGEAAALLSERAGVTVPREVASELARSTGGNPLALVELSTALSADQLSGRTRLPPQLPLTEGVERAFLDRYRRLPRQAQTLLLVAAADDTGRMATVRQAARRLAVGDEALDDVEESGLLQVDGTGVQLRHPLVRSAVYGAATSRMRRAVHQALADVLAGDHNADRRAWHRAAAAEEPDDAVVAELDQVAENARRRGGHEAASAALERAAELTADPEHRAERLHDAARAAWLAGQAARARTLADTARPIAGEPSLRADLARLRAHVEWNTGSVQLAHRMLVEGAAEVAPYDPVRAREMAMYAAGLAATGGDSGIDIRPTDLVADPAPAAPAREHCFANLLTGLDHLAHGNTGEAAQALRAAFSNHAFLASDDQELLPNLAIAAVHIGDDEAALRYYNTMLARARSTGAVMTILYSLTRLGFVNIATGSWSTASASASEALHLAEGTGQPPLTALPLAWQTLIAALRGDQTYPTQLSRTEAVAAEAPMGILAALVQDALRWSKGIRNAARPAVSHHHLSQISLPLLRHGAAIDRIETAIRAGHREQAAAWADETQRFAEATGTAWSAAAAAHGRAVLATGSAAEDHFTQALDHHAASARVFDRARTELAYGELLRRARRRLDARPHLRAALETFTELRAREWEDRANRELRACGETARRRDPSAAADLTAQERQVATLVRHGMPNREVAAQLFLSPRTIDYHLRNVYTKLGISSRTQLASQQLD